MALYTGGYRHFNLHFHGAQVSVSSDNTTAADIRLLYASVT